MSDTLVSVIIRTRNRPKLLKEALDSVKQQKYQNLEIVVVNDGGEDVAEILNDTRQDFKINYINLPEHLGRTKAANIGLKNATGEWILFLDDDDLLLPNAIEDLLSMSKLGPVVYGIVEAVKSEPDGSCKTVMTFEKPFSKEELAITNYIPICGLLFKRDIAIKVGGFDEEFDLLEDWDFIYRLSLETDFIFLRKKVAIYRFFGRSLSEKKDWKSWELEIEARVKFYKKHLPNIHPEKMAKATVFFIASMTDLHKEIQKKEKIISELKIKNAELSYQLQEVLNSTSWKITSPARKLKPWIKTAYMKTSNFFLLASKFLNYSRNYGIQAAIKKAKVKLAVSKYIPQSSTNYDDFENLQYKPLISIVVPVYNPPKEFLTKCIESVVNQIYSNWELCIADDASTKPYVKEILEKFRRLYSKKIKVIYREKNGHICEATNTALSLATGEFVAFLDHDDELTPDALLEVVKLLNRYPNADIIYSDEDKIDAMGRISEPSFKPDWSPEYLLSCMYTCHLSVYRKSLLDKLGGLRKGFEGSQDHDLMLRASELTDKIYHIPKVLYHWRKHSKSAAQNPESKKYACEAAKKALEEALKRRELKGKVEQLERFSGFYHVHLIPKTSPLASIVIPTKDLAEDLDRCIDSIVSKSTYKNFEFVIVDNGSLERKTFKVFEKWKDRLKDRFNVFRIDEDFNFSRLVNFGVEKSRGEVIVLLNNDTELIGPSNWIEEMLGYCEIEGVACVGPLLLYPNGKVQHAGVILGIGSVPPRVAGHAFPNFSPNEPGYMGRLLVPSNYSALTAACLMVERKKWNEVNGFDENIPVAFNDVDFCLKLLSRGYRHVFLPFVKFYHHESKTRGYEDTPEKQERFKREVEIMLKRWRHLIENDPYYNPNLPKNKCFL